MPTKPKKKKLTKLQKQIAEEKLNKKIEKAKLQVAERREIQRGERAGWVIAFAESSDLIYFYGTEIQCEEQRRTNAYQRKTRGIKRLALPLEDKLQKPIRGINKLESKFTYRKKPLDWKDHMVALYPETSKAQLRESEKAAEKNMEIREKIRKTHIAKRDASFAENKKNRMERYAKEAADKAAKIAEDARLQRMKGYHKNVKKLHEDRKNRNKLG